MFNNRKSLVRSLVVVTMIMVLGLVAGAQMTATPASIRLMVAATGDEVEVLEDQINRFEEQNPDIWADLLIVPFAEFKRVLWVLIAAGTPPDVVALSYNDTAELQMQGLLQTLDELVVEFGMDLYDFVPDALESNRFYGQLYGLPRRRSACEPHYRNLALFKASEHPSEAFALMDFLTQPEQQEQNYKESQWFPTRRSVEETLGIDCPSLPEVIRLAPEDVALVTDMVNARSSSLEPVLEGETINAYEATAVIEEGEIQAAVAPVMDPISKEEFEAELGDGVIVGALFVNVDLDVMDSSGRIVGTIEAGDYAVKWRAYAFRYKVYLPLLLRSFEIAREANGRHAIVGAGNAELPQISVPFGCAQDRPWKSSTDYVGNTWAKFYLLKPDSPELEVRLVHLDDTGGPVGQPFCTVQEASIRICWHIDGLRGCIRIG